MTHATDASLPPTFNRLAWSNLAAQSAEQIALAAAPIVAVLMLGVGEGETGLLQTALTLPFVLFAIPAGWLADRMSRRWLMAGAEALRALALFGILVLIWSNLLTLNLLALIGFVAVCGTVVYSVAAPALVPIAGAAGHAARRQRADRTCPHGGVRGRAGAGRRPGWMDWRQRPHSASPPRCLSWRSSCSPGSSSPRAPPTPRRHPLREIKEGASFVFQHALLRPVFITQFIFNTASFLILAVFVPYAVRALDLSATGVGVTLGMYGAGMVVGALLATRVIKRLPFGTVIAIGPIAGFVAAVVMALTTFVPSSLLAGLSFFLLGAGPILWVISTTTLRQSVTPPSLLGRVSAINIMAYGARPLGAGARSTGRQQLWRRGVLLSGGGGIWRAGAGHPHVAGRQADPPTGHVRGAASDAGGEVLRRFAALRRYLKLGQVPDAQRLVRIGPAALGAALVEERQGLRQVERRSGQVQHPPVAVGGIRHSGDDR